MFSRQFAREAKCWNSLKAKYHAIYIIMYYVLRITSNLLYRSCMGGNKFTSISLDSEIQTIHKKRKKTRFKRHTRVRRETSWTSAFNPLWLILHSTNLLDFYQVSLSWRFEKKSKKEIITDDLQFNKLQVNYRTCLADDEVRYLPSMPCHVMSCVNHYRLHSHSPACQHFWFEDIHLLFCVYDVCAIKNGVNLHVQFVKITSLPHYQAPSIEKMENFASFDCITCELWLPLFDVTFHPVTWYVQPQFNQYNNISYTEMVRWHFRLTAQSDCCSLLEKCAAVCRISQKIRYVTDMKDKEEAVWRFYWIFFKVLTIEDFKDSSPSERQRYATF